LRACVATFPLHLLLELSPFCAKMRKGGVSLSMIGSGFGVLVMIGVVAVYIFVGVVIWRFMRAHESIAESIKIIASNLKKEP